MLTELEQCVGALDDRLSIGTGASLTASDLGQGSIVEAGIDHVRILKAACAGDRTPVLPGAPPTPVSVTR